MMLKKFIMRLVSFNNATRVIVCLLVLLMVQPSLLFTILLGFLTCKFLAQKSSLLCSDNESIRKDSFEPLTQTYP